MTTTRKPLLSPTAKDSIHDRRTELVKEMVAKENAATDAKTAKLKALRMAKEAEDLATAPPPPVKRKRSRSSA